MSFNNLRCVIISSVVFEDGFLLIHFVDVASAIYWILRFIISTNIQIDAPATHNVMNSLM